MFPLYEVTMSLKLNSAASNHNALGFELSVLLHVNTFCFLLSVISGTFMSSHLPLLIYHEVCFGEIPCMVDSSHFPLSRLSEHPTQDDSFNILIHILQF